MRFERNNPIGAATRFQAGNPGGPGRPRTGRLREGFRRVADRWGDKAFISNGHQFGEYVLAEALKGDKDARALYCRVLGRELAKQWISAAKNALESGNLRIRQHPRPVPKLRITAKKQAQECPRADFADVSQEFRTPAPVIPANLHRIAENLVGVEREGRPVQAPRKPIKVQLW